MKFTGTQIPPMENNNNKEKVPQIGRIKLFMPTNSRKKVGPCNS